jgi:hypothetical protein
MAAPAHCRHSGARSEWRLSTLSEIRLRILDDGNRPKAELSRSGLSAVPLDDPEVGKLSRTAFASMPDGLLILGVGAQGEGVIRASWLAKRHPLTPVSLPLLAPFHVAALHNALAEIPG